MKTMGTFGEFTLISELRSSFVKAKGRLKVAIGDDAAVFEEKSGKSLLATTDMMVEGVHFTGSLSPFKVGQKAIASNVSDIAAMGGKPLYGLVSVGLRKNVPYKYAKELLNGIKKEALKYKVGIIGGDTVSSKVNTINIVLLGEVDGKKYALRSGAKEGDFIVVTGTLGRGAAMLLKNGIYIPKIPAAFAEEAVKAGFIHGMIDVSDGLSSELHHLAKESGLGAFIDIKATPVAPSTKKIALLKKKAVYDMALHGGEDYELLFTVAPKFLRRVLKLGKGKTRLTVLGVMRDKKCGVKYSDVDGELKVLPRKGYDHFA
ncbi:MAG: thiamine-phosphate kinase [Candidatus Firestonebacteria bacterium RIFOXYC2_FULL_39_67]|nr:MAG: thiamine-phosphate kinase [Candidatus Firestonebacteria bacterium RIFOXYD2_FULL_39_29]OGF55566.1 MAG: thiamine-phosphate kinase [Candidatus Firestonebacteria bacterium RIFOXYC2_FULL_39_67]